MISQLKSWIVNICSTVFFITAVEMLLPNNSLKKYGKFVLGLILVSVLINPIIKLFNKDFDMKFYANNMLNEIEQNEYKKDIDTYKNKNIENTLDNFENNLEKICIEKLEEKYPSTNFKVEVQASFDDKKEKFKIHNINIGVKEGKVDKVRKIEINLKNKDLSDVEKVDKQIENDIKNYLSSLFKINKDVIFVYKL